MPKHSMVRDPLIIKTLVEQRPSLPLAVGLDLATNCGAAFGYFDPKDPKLKIEQLWAGQWDLSADSYESGAIRFVRLRQLLFALNPSVIFYENVRATPPVIPGKMMSPAQIMARAAPAAELIGAFRATVATYAEEQNVPCVGFSIGEIKKYATGKGVADKPLMIKAANDKFGAGLDPEGYETSGTDNIADALWVLDLGLSLYGRGVPNEVSQSAG